jgi:hypothetical protein
VLTIIVELIPYPIIFIPRAPTLILLSLNVPEPTSTLNGFDGLEYILLLTAYETVANASVISGYLPLLLLSSSPPFRTYIFSSYLSPINKIGISIKLVDVSDGGLVVSEVEYLILFTDVVPASVVQPPNASNIYFPLSNISPNS